MNIKSGDIYDIGQTINGVSEFLYLNEKGYGKWYYVYMLDYGNWMVSEYHYDYSELSKKVSENVDGEVTYLGNIFVDNYKFDSPIIIGIIRDKKIDSIL